MKKGLGKIDMHSKSWTLLEVQITALIKLIRNRKARRRKKAAPHLFINTRPRRTGVFSWRKGQLLQMQDIREEGGNLRKCKNTGRKRGVHIRNVRQARHF